MDLKEKKEGREGEKEKDEVSRDPVTSLFLGTYNLGKELRGKKGREDGKRGEKERRKEEEEEEEEETKRETEERRVGSSLLLLQRPNGARWR